MMGIAGAVLLFLGGVTMRLSGTPSNRLWNIGLIMSLTGILLLFLGILRYYLPLLWTRFFPRKDSTEEDETEDEETQDEETQDEEIQDESEDDNQ